MPAPPATDAMGMWLLGEGFFPTRCLREKLDIYSINLQLFSANPIPQNQFPNHLDQFQNLHSGSFKCFGDGNTL